MNVNRKDYSFKMRMTKDEFEKLNYLAKKMKITKTEVVNQGIRIQYNSYKNKD